MSNKKSFLQKDSHWFWFMILMVGYGVYDCLEHISRENQIFREYPLKWTLFTFFSTFTVMTLTYVFSTVLQRLHLREIVGSSIGFALSFAIHLKITGPLWDNIFWFDELYFSQILMPTSILTGFYLVFRLMFWLSKKILLMVKLS